MSTVDNPITSVQYVDGVITTVTNTPKVDVFMRVNCRFEHVRFTGGTYTGELLEIAPFVLEDTHAQSATRSCTVTLTPVVPPL